MSACAESGTVKRVVLTSSIAAVSCGLSGHPGRQNHTYSEEDWSPPEACAPYERSKTLAEKAAWDFVKGLPEEKRFDLAVINPGLVIGPILTEFNGTSVGLLKSILTGEIPGCLDVNPSVVDVRDVAQAHIVAMEKPECRGKRYILVSESNVPFRTIYQIINKEFSPQGYKANMMKIPKFVAWFVAKFNGGMEMLYPTIGKHLTYVNDRLINELGIQPREIEQTIIDTGYSLIEFGLVKKTAKYRGPGSKPEVDDKGNKNDGQTTTEQTTYNDKQEEDEKETSNEPQD